MKACYVEVFKEGLFNFDTTPMSPKEALRLADWLAELFVKATPNAKAYRDVDADQTTANNGYEIWVYELAKNEGENDIDHRHIIVK